MSSIDCNINSCELLFLPVNMSSKSQPLGIGIIQTIKPQYMCHTMTTVFALIISTANEDEPIKKFQWLKKMNTLCKHGINQTIE